MLGLGLGSGLRLMFVLGFGTARVRVTVWPVGVCSSVAGEGGVSLRPWVEAVVRRSPEV